jgi:hypothetical protein
MQFCLVYCVYCWYILSTRRLNCSRAKLMSIITNNHYKYFIIKHLQSNLVAVFSEADSAVMQRGLNLVNGNSQSCRLRVSRSQFKN